MTSVNHLNYFKMQELSVTIKTNTHEDLTELLNIVESSLLSNDIVFKQEKSDNIKRNVITEMLVLELILGAVIGVTVERVAKLIIDKIKNRKDKDNYRLIQREREIEFVDIEKNIKMIVREKEYINEKK